MNWRLSFWTGTARRGVSSACGAEGCLVRKTNLVTDRLAGLRLEGRTWLHDTATHNGDSSEGRGRASTTVGADEIIAAAFDADFVTRAAMVARREIALLPRHGYPPDITHGREVVHALKGAATTTTTTTTLALLADNVSCPTPPN
jgi:hypothetical protein